MKQIEGLNAGSVAALEGAVTRMEDLAYASRSAVLARQLPAGAEREAAIETLLSTLAETGVTMEDVAAARAASGEMRAQQRAIRRSI